MTSFWILTSPRATADPWQYVKRTVEQLEAEHIYIGAPAKNVVVDATQEAFEQLAGELAGFDWTLHRFERPPAQQILGNKLPYWYLLELALEHGAGGDVVALEDDLELCRNAGQRMMLFPIPLDLAWVQFYSGWTLTAPKMNPGLWRVPPTPMQGCQAIKFPRRTLEQLVAWQRDPEFTKYNESDVALGLAQERLDLRYGCHCPDVVQHEGGMSRVEQVIRENAGAEPQSDNLAALRGRQSKNYSRDLDALKLFGMHRLYR